jgi:polyphosphate kinase 2 (PPK2 family)
LVLFFKKELLPASRAMAKKKIKLSAGEGKRARKRRRTYSYVEELVRLRFELIKLQEWVRREELRVVVICAAP